MPPDWTPPPGVEGDAPLLRAYVGAARPGERSCPQYRAVKARPNVVDSLRQPGKRRGLEKFGLKVLNDLLDVNVLFNDSPDEAVALYNKFARGQVRESVDGGEYRPGNDCADCALVAVCPAVPKRPGILGIYDWSMPRRSWSATDGRYYAKCPAMEYQRRVGLGSAPGRRTSCGRGSCSPT